jgi:hypothetical protein
MFLKLKIKTQTYIYLHYRIFMVQLRWKIYRQGMICLEFKGCYIEDNHDKYIYINTNNLLNLKEILGLLTRSQLNNMFKVLRIQETGLLKIEILRETLEKYIKNNIQLILARLTKNEYDLLQRLLKNHGELQYEDGLSNIIVYLSKLGIVFLKNYRDHKKMIAMPLDIYEQCYYYTFNSFVSKRIRLNEKVNKVLEDIIYYYGMLDTENLYNIFYSLFDERIDKTDLMDILNENRFKITEVSFCEGYWYHRKQ